MLKRGEIMGSDARCEAMMLAFCEFIESYTTPPETVKEMIKKRYLRGLVDEREIYICVFVRD